ncbi:MAG TPA: S24 family peptidase [Nitrospirota bacterium]|jgi:hypothetical protein
MTRIMGMKTFGQKIKDAMARGGFRSIRECALSLELPYELLRKVACEDHIPKDEQVMVYADKLGLDRKDLLFTAYRQKAPAGFRQLFERYNGVSESGLNVVPVLPWDYICEARYENGRLVLPEGCREIKTELEGCYLFAATISAKSSHPAFSEGETIIVDPEARPEQGSFVLACRADGPPVIGQIQKKRKGWAVVSADCGAEGMQVGKNIKVLGIILRKQMDF